MTSETDSVEHTTSARLDDVSSLRRGDQVEAIAPDKVRHRGRVEETAPEMGVVWITEEPLGNRTMLDAVDYSIRIISS
ncbi:hypothetical protein [Arthrobacter crystallopoietes]|uniref:hypothetical protein n=1 Tax=Crystallibacter crystallopoietes TaxID=37928 RepID=UPI0011115382|nr:hypothetical protein [Arthrobacter crystallopoietes]